MTGGGDPAIAYLDARDRLLKGLYERLSRMNNAELGLLTEWLASSRSRGDTAEPGRQHPSS